MMAFGKPAFVTRATVSIAALLANLFLTGIDARADGDATSWTPSLGITISFHSQSLKSNVESELTVFGQGGENPIQTPLFGFGAMLRSPALGGNRYTPRLFAHAGIQLPLQTKFDVQSGRVLIGPFTPDAVENCPAAQFNTATPPRSGSCSTTSSATLTLKHSMYAGVGVELTLPFFQRLMRLRPAIDYYREALKFSGNAFRFSSPAFPEPPYTDSISVSSGTRHLQGLGPSLQLAINVLESGSLALNVFLETRFYWILTGNKISSSGASELNPEKSTTFFVEPDDFVAQGGAGLRLVWQGN